MSNALWRIGEGRAIEALRAAGTAMKTDVVVLLGINDLLGVGKGVEMDVVGGVCALALSLMAGLRSERTFVHVLELPLLPMYSVDQCKLAMRINMLLQKHSAEVGFKVHCWSWDRLGRNSIALPKSLLKILPSFETYLNLRFLNSLV